MSRVLLLCFVHGFKGSDNSFHDFPTDLKIAVGKTLPDDRVVSVVYPRYETKGELAEAASSFLEWLKEQVLALRKQHCDVAWPPHDRQVGVILVSHSMGGFVAADALFLALNERAASSEGDAFLFPLIQGILAFDTPYNGLARSMFVYGAFSNYQKVNTVFNAMTALTAAAPAGLSRLTSRSAVASAVPSQSRRGPQWTAWQLLAVKTGTVGAIAAGGVAAYMHREAIMRGMKSVRNMNKDSIAEGYRNSMDALGQGLAYINRGNVGKSFAWLSDHLTFVGALLKQKELNRRLERLAALKGVPVHDMYISLGENGYWSGGYFVPERTFCAVPEGDHGSSQLFSRIVVSEATDEVEAHTNMFRSEKNSQYLQMIDRSVELVKEWFRMDEPIVDDEGLRDAAPEETVEDKTVDEVLTNDLTPEETEKAAQKIETEESKASQEQDENAPDESHLSPIDIAAAASLVPLPGSEDTLVADASTDMEGVDPEEKRTYLQYLFQVAQQAGTGAKGFLPSQTPAFPQVSVPHMPKMPAVPSVPSSLKQMSVPGMGFLGRKKEDDAAEASEEKPTETPTKE